jgi:4-diphosphocytidyl-2-C-methyl-D-erythritol kinase
MIVFPNAKINLGLHVLVKRPDGFHNLETVFLPVGWCDVLEIIRSEKAETEFTQTGTRLYGDIHSNLCMKAYHLLASKHSIGPVHMHLHKLIPIGAGLGGGSSDAAFTLVALNSLFQLNLSTASLQDYASQLAATALFLSGTPLRWLRRKATCLNLPM